MAQTKITGFGPMIETNGYVYTNDLDYGTSPYTHTFTKGHIKLEVHRWSARYGVNVHGKEIFSGTKKQAFAFAEDWMGNN